MVNYARLDLRIADGSINKQNVLETLRHPTLDLASNDLLVTCYNEQQWLSKPLTAIMSEPVAMHSLPNKKTEKDFAAISDAPISTRLKPEVSFYDPFPGRKPEPRVPPIDICQQLRTTSLCMNRILGEPALGRHVRSFYVGVVMDDVQNRLVEI